MADPIVVLDANVLVPITTTDLLLRLAVKRLFVPLWSAAIHDEWMRNVLRIRPDLTPARVDRRRREMDREFPAATVTGYEPLVDGLELPDPDDRHVLAAAIHGKATEIVTFNLDDFPPDRLSPFGLVPAHPDEFVRRLIGESPDLGWQVLRQMEAESKVDLSQRLRAVDLHGTAAMVLAASV